MSNKQLRFGIFEGNKRSATWNIQNQRNKKTGLPEVYLFSRQLKDSLHASMHSSGKWHIAYPKEFFNENVKGLVSEEIDRFVDKWERPVEIKPGVTLAFKIIAPYSAVSTKDIDDGKKIEKIPNAPKGKATQILILFIDPKIDFSLKNSDKVGELLLSNGERLVVLHHVVNIPNLKLPKSKGSLIFFKDKSMRDLLRGNIKVIIPADADDGSKVIMDLSVKIGLKLKVKALFWKTKDFTKSRFVIITKCLRKK